MTRFTPAPPALCLRRTPFGQAAAVWSVRGGRPGILRVFLSGPGEPAGRAAGRLFPGARLSSCREIDRVADGIEAFLNGGDVRFPLDALRLDLCSPFQQRVLRADRAIPRGRVTSYALVARRLDTPGGARAVGAALAANPFPIVIPCHRVILSDGSAGGFGYGSEMKRALLEMEGVAFDGAGRASAGDFFFL